jgi:hypothetical protein
VRRVRAVIAADDQEEVEPFFEHVAQSILPLLCGAADRVEEAEAFARPFGAVAVANRSFDAALHLLGFAAHHRRLIGHADATQVQIGIKPAL